MLSDVRHALRSLARSPGFSFVAIATLALAIGVNATIFSFVREMVLRPLVRDRLSHLVAIHTATEGPNKEFRPFSYREFTALRGATDVFSDVAATNFGKAILGRDDEFRSRLICFVSENYFTLLGVRPLHGRFFSEAEARPNAGVPVVVANHALWKRLGSPANFVGSEILINQLKFTVIGVTPEGFGGFHVSIGPDVWLPLGARSTTNKRADDLMDTRTTQLSLCAGLRAGLTLETARLRLGGIENGLNELAGGGEKRRLVLTPPPRFSIGDGGPVEEDFLAPFATLTLGLAVVVLIVAGLNLANMFLARSTARIKEIAVRCSLGASRWQVVRLLFVEGVLLALAGCGAGLLLAVWCGDVLRELVVGVFGGGMFALTTHPMIDGSLVVWALGCSIVGAFVFSLGPALRATKINLVDDLKRQSGEPSGTDRWNRFFALRHCLVMAQIALSLALLFSAGLFFRGALEASGRDVGFRTDGELVFNVNYDSTGELSTSKILPRQQQMLARAGEVPGVASAALASAVPFSFGLNFNKVFPAAADAGPAVPGVARIESPAGYTAVSRGYFETLGIPLLRGRDFTAGESEERESRPVAIIDDLLARALFGAQDALGRHIVIDESDASGAHVERPVEIVGIVRSPHDDVFEKDPPRRLYRPLAQVRAPNIFLHIRVGKSVMPADVLARVRGELRALQPDLPLLAARPLSDYIDKNLNLLLVRMAAGAFGMFGVVALLLAVVGVYGVKSYAIVRRTREIGIRMALGARPADVAALVMKQGALQTAAGVGVGALLALGFGRLLASMLYRVSPFDPIVLFASALVLAVATLLACWWPARRATRVDPVVALRSE